MTTGEIIRKARINRNISADELAWKIGVSTTTLYRYETGKTTKIPATTIVRISRVLDVSLLRLLLQKV